MTDETKALGLRAMAAGFFPSPGSEGFCGGAKRRVIMSDEDMLVFQYHMQGAVNGFIPDFDDPATLGILLAQVREAWDQPHLVCVRWGGQWACTYGTSYFAHSDTEAGSLVNALEAAPKGAE